MTGHGIIKRDISLSVFYPILKASSNYTTWPALYDVHYAYKLSTTTIISASASFNFLFLNSTYPGPTLKQPHSDRSTIQHFQPVGCV